MKTGDEPIVLEQTFNSSIESVWNAITEIEQMRQWYFENIPAFKPEIGFETQFNVQSNHRNFLHKWKVTELQHLKLITYSWKFEDYPGKSTGNRNVSGIVAVLKFCNKYNFVVQQSANELN
jgi:uncharacterized protein YndB with AHSA1/START domain